MKICHPCNLKYEDSKKFCRQCGGALVMDMASMPEVLIKRESFEKKIISEPHNIEHLLAYGEYLASVDLNNEALVQFLRAQEVEPAHGAVLRGLATVYHALRQTEKAADFLARLSLPVPNNIDILLERLNLLRELADRDAELLAVCKSIHALKPYVYPVCSLYCGIGKLAAVPDTGMKDELAEAEKLLAHAFSNPSGFTAREKACGMLHWCHVRLNLGLDASPIAAELKNIDRGQIEDREYPILSGCLFLLGKSWLDREMLNEAIGIFKESLELADTPEVREQLANAYEIRGDHKAGRGKEGAACDDYLEGLRHCPGKISLQDKTNAIKAKQARLIRKTVVTLCIVIGLAALFYYGQGRISIKTDSPANIALGEPPFQSASDDVNLVTQFLFFRSYLLKITKPGYVTIEQSVKPAFGRGIKELSFNLVPSYGSVKVNSDPAGARAVVRNPYEAKVCTTPCEVIQLFAMPSEVELQLSGYETFKSRIDVPADKTHDLGTVVFKGGLKVDSMPSAAEVFINGKASGQTPLTLEGLPARKTMIEIRKEREGLYVASVPILPGIENNLGVVTLSKLAAIRVESLPAGAGVRLDGRLQVGKTPLFLNDLAVGRHSIRVEYPGVQPFEKEVSLAAGEIVDVGVVSFQGSIKIASKPVGASVYINGEKKGATPLTITGVLAGATSVRLVQGGLEVTVTAQVRRNETTDLGVLNLDGHKDLVTGMEFVMVPGGCFKMGSPASEIGRFGDEESPQHEVCVGSFLMGKYEVTVGQFKKYVEATNYRTEAEAEGWSYGLDSNGKWGKQSGRNWRDPGFRQTDNEPVVCVSWNDAQRFVSWMNKNGRGYQMPTEAEWEYAARAGSRTARPWGEDPSGACQYANVADRTLKRRYSGWETHECDDGYLYTAPVGSFKANAFGLHDMIGNAWEWCADWFDKNYYSSSPMNNPGGPSSGSSRVNRGGSWYYTPRGARSALRGSIEPGARGDYLGFRLALPPGQ